MVFFQELAPKNHFACNFNLFLFLMPSMRHFSKNWLFFVVKQPTRTRFIIEKTYCNRCRKHYLHNVHFIYFGLFNISFVNRIMNTCIRKFVTLTSNTPWTRATGEWVSQTREHYTTLLGCTVLAHVVQTHNFV